MPRVFVAERVQHDINAATAFGEILYLLPDNHRATWKTTELTEFFIARLDELQYDPATDHIVIVGNNILLATLVAAIACEWGEFKTLCYHAVRQQYTERTMGIPL